MISEPLAVFLTLAAIVYLSIRLEQHVALARALGSVLLAIVLAAVVANLGILPAASPVYEMLGGVGVNLGIALILLGVDVRSVVRAGPTMLAAFGLGAAATVVGAIAAALALQDAVGPETWKLAGQYTGTYIGGGVNMVAVGRALETSSDVFAAAVAADNVTTALWMVFCFGAPVMIGKFWAGGAAGGVGAGDSHAQSAFRRQYSSLTSAPNTDGGPRTAEASPANIFTSSLRATTISDSAALALLAVAAVWVSSVIGAWIPGVPQVLWLTTLVLVLAQLGPVRALAGGPMWGNYILQLFLASLGAQSIVAEIVRVGPAIFYFTLLVVGLHGLLLFGVGRALRLDLPTLAVASQANVGGPASAMALATARGYPDRLLPGIAVGLLGYAVGNYLGFGVARLMQAWIS